MNFNPQRCMDWKKRGGMDLNSEIQILGIEI